MSKIVLILALSSTLLYHSCGTTKPDKDSTTKTESIDQVEALPELNLSDQSHRTRQTSATKYWKLLHTQLSIDPDISQNTAEGEALIWLTPYAHASTDSISIDAKYLKIQEVQLCDNPIMYSYQTPSIESQNLKYDKTPYRLNIKLPTDYLRGDTLCIKIAYTVSPDSVPSGGSESIRERKGIYMLHPDSHHKSRPTQLWTQGEPESASFWFPTLDAPNQKTTQVLRVTYPTGNRSISNGVLSSSSTTDEQITDTWVNDLPISPYLFTLVVGPFYTDSSDSYLKIPLNYHVDSPYADYAREIYDHTPEMLQYFSELTGVPYPWQKYSQVLVHDFVSGAMENTSAVTFGSFIQKNNRELLDENNDMIVAHEMFHHWFGDLVTFESWNHITLSESFATLGALLWQGHEGGPDVEAYERHKMLQRYLRVSRADEPPLLRNYYEKPGEVFDRISYQKGASVLYMLRDMIGTQNFSAAMQLYLNTHAYKSAEISHWRQALEEVTGQDMAPFFDQWYYTPGLPRIRVTIRDDDSLQLRKLILSYVDSSSLYDLDIKVAYKQGPVDSIMVLSVRDSTQSWDFGYVDGVAPHLIVDPQHKMALRLTYICPPAYWDRVLSSNPHYDDFYAAMQAIKNAKKEDVQLSLVQLATKRKPGVSYLAARYLEPSIANDPMYRTKLLTIAEDQSENPNLRAELVHSLGRSNDSNSIAWLRRMSSDYSYKVCASALLELDSLDHDYAVRYAYDSLHTAKSKLYEACMSILAEQDSSLSRDMLISEVQSHYGRECYYPALYLNKSLSYIESQTDYEKVVDVLIKKAAYDDLKSLDEYILKNLYSKYIALTKEGKITKAEYIKTQVEQVLYTAWEDPDRVEILREVYTWQVKF